MKYLKKNLDSFLKRNQSNEIKVIENVNYHKTRVTKLGQIILPDPDHGDLKLSVMPFENTGGWVSLPEGFKIWEQSFNDVLKHIPLQEGANTHYVTIDTKFFTKDEFLRREGVHIDGNFCVDPNFKSLNEYKSSWGGASPMTSWGGAKFKHVEVQEEEEEEEEYKSSWGGPRPSWGGARYKASNEGYKEMPDNSHVDMDWVLPYNIVIPISEYVSSHKGGILTTSTAIGCQAWNGEFYGEIMNEGSFEKMEDQLTDDKKVIFEKDQLYFMSSNTPHETLLQEKGTRRTFLRITLNHNYLNSNIK